MLHWKHDTNLIEDIDFPKKQKRYLDQLAFSETFDVAKFNANKGFLSKNYWKINLKWLGNNQMTVNLCKARDFVRIYHHTIDMRAQIERERLKHVTNLLQCGQNYVGALMEYNNQIQFQSDVADNVNINIAELIKFNPANRHTTINNNNLFCNPPTGANPSANKSESASRTQPGLKRTAEEVKTGLVIGKNANIPKKSSFALLFNGGDIEKRPQFLGRNVNLDEQRGTIKSVTKVKTIVTTTKKETKTKTKMIVKRKK